MKRVKAACICQTLHFLLKDDVSVDYAKKLVKDDVEQYKRTLERNHTQYRIVEETEQPDGSVMVKVIKQYNSSPIGDYLKYIRFFAKAVRCRSGGNPADTAAHYFCVYTIG